MSAEFVWQVAFFRSVARESVLFLIFDAHSFLPAHWVGFVLGFWFCLDRPTKVFFSPRRERRRQRHRVLLWAGVICTLSSIC